MSDDRKLLESYCRKSDQSAFNTFYRQQADRLWRFLRARGEQNLLLLRYWIGLTHKEIAINLKLPEGTGQSKITAEIPLLRLVDRRLFYSDPNYFDLVNQVRFDCQSLKPKPFWRRPS